jgi:hypothetical protein
MLKVAEDKNNLILFSDDSEESHIFRKHKQRLILQQFGLTSKNEEETVTIQ